MKSGYIFLFILLFIFSINIISAETIGTFKQDQAIELYQTCNNCTYCNLSSVKYPNGTSILSNIAMTEDDTYYNYFLSSDYTSEIGIHKYCYDCGNLIESETGCIDFEINPQGFELRSGQETIYSTMLIVVLLIFLITLYYGVNIPWENHKTPDGNIVAIDYKKYLKLALLFVSYLTLIFFFAIGKGMSYTFLQSTEAYGFFNVGFSILLVGVLPVFILCFSLIVMGAIFDRKVQESLSRGLPTN